MSTTQYGVNHPLAVKLWSKKLFQEALKTCWMSKFIGPSSDSMIQTKTELQKSAGDKITFGLRMQLTGTGVQGDGTLEGNEEALTTYSDSVLINQMRHAVRSDGKMSEQRVPFSVRDEARTGLQDWFTDRIDTSIINQLAGNTGQTNTIFTGNNTVTGPSTNNIYYPNGTTTEAQVSSATTSNIMKITYIDALVEKAQTLTPKIRPLKINGEEKYVLFLHPYQVTDLRNNTNTGQWFDIQKAALQGGQISDNPIYNGALAEYNGVIIHVSTRIPFVTANVARAIFCGAQAGVIAYGQDNSDSEMSWVEKLFDYENQLGVSAGMIWGAKKTIFNSQDFATIVLPTYAVAH